MSSSPDEHSELVLIAVLQYIHGRMSCDLYRTFDIEIILPTVLRLDTLIGHVIIKIIDLGVQKSQGQSPTAESAPSVLVQ